MRNFNSDVSNFCKIYPKVTNTHPIKKKKINQSYIQYNEFKKLNTPKNNQAIIKENSVFFGKTQTNSFSKAFNSKQIIRRKSIFDSIMKDDTINLCDSLNQSL